MAVGQNVDDGRERVVYVAVGCSQPVVSTLHRTEPVLARSAVRRSSRDRAVAVVDTVTRPLPLPSSPYLYKSHNPKLGAFSLGLSLP
jgi:hypothetical protein